MEKTFGQLLKELRRAKKISQRDLAEKVKVDFSYISKVENGRLPPPSAETIEKICAALEIPSEILLAKSGKITPKMLEALTQNEEALKFLNEVKMMNLTTEEWQKLNQNLKKLR